MPKLYSFMIDKIIQFQFVSKFCVNIPVIFLIMIKFLIVVETIKKEKEIFINISILSWNSPVNHANPNLEIPPRAK